MLPDPCPEREPASVREERLRRERISRGVPPTKQVATPAPGAFTPPAPDPLLPLEPERPAPLPASTEQLIGSAVKELLARTPERVILELPRCTVTLLSSAVSISQHSVMILFDPAVCSVEIGYETELTVVYRGQRVKVIYGGGQGRFPNWPFQILSFLVLHDDDQDRQS